VGIPRVTRPATHREAPALIAIGVLKIKAKVGELMPAKSRREAGALGGRGKKNNGEPHQKGASASEAPFATEALAAYRKLAEHAEKLDDYYEADQARAPGRGGGGPATATLSPRPTRRYAGRRTTRQGSNPATGRPGASARSTCPDPRGADGSGPVAVTLDCGFDVA